MRENGSIIYIIYMEILREGGLENRGVWHDGGRRDGLLPKLKVCAFHLQEHPPFADFDSLELGCLRGFVVDKSLQTILLE